MASENGSVLLVLLAIVLCLSFVTIGGSRSNEDDEKHLASVDREDEEAELEGQLKILNKPPVKTIRTDYGDIIDCVDIYKQPAFDHPLLKHHKIQRRPTKALSQETGWGKKAPSSIAKNPNFTSKKCPPNTVPIRRTTKEGLKRYRSFMQHSSFHPLLANSDGNHYALLDVRSRKNEMFHGAAANIDACNPRVDRVDQISTGQIFIEAGPLDQINSIQSGWLVHRALYGDARARFFTYWTGNNTRNGCFDVLCPGFVQVSPEFSLGQPLSNISKYDGPLFFTTMKISQDPITKNWWLYYSAMGTPVGYWPKDLFPFLSDGATRIGFGGRTGSNIGETSPPMGNGYFPDGSYYHSCFFINIQVMVDPQRGLLAPTNLERTPNVDTPNCYGLRDLGVDDKQGYSILFGGPGGLCGG